MIPKQFKIQIRFESIKLYIDYIFKLINCELEVSSIKKFK